MGFPKFQWFKGHGLPQSGKGHYGLREKDSHLISFIWLGRVDLVKHMYLQSIASWLCKNFLGVGMHNVFTLPLSKPYTWI